MRTENSLDQLRQSWVVFLKLLPRVDVVMIVVVLPVGAEPRLHAFGPILVDVCCRVRALSEPFLGRGNVAGPEF